MQQEPLNAEHLPQRERYPKSRFDVFERLYQLHLDIARRNGGRPLSSSVPIIRKAREERDRDQ
jgi:hypothetical protein